MYQVLPSATGTVAVLGTQLTSGGDPMTAATQSTLAITGFAIGFYLVMATALVLFGVIVRWYGKSVAKDSQK